MPTVGWTLASRLTTVCQDLGRADKCSRKLLSRLSRWRSLARRQLRLPLGVTRAQTEPTSRLTPELRRTIRPTTTTATAERHRLPIGLSPSTALPRRPSLRVLDILATASRARRRSVRAPIGLKDIRDPTEPMCSPTIGALRADCAGALG